MRVWMDTRRQYNLKSEMWTEHLCTFSSLISVDCFPLWAQKLVLRKVIERAKRKNTLACMCLCCVVLLTFASPKGTSNQSMEKTPMENLMENLIYI